MADMTTTHGSLDALQRRRKKQSRPAALVPLLLFTTGWAPEGRWYREGLEAAALFLIVAGIFGRASSPLDIGGRKARQPVTAGPYSLNRNSLHLFAVIAAAGLGTQTGSPTVAGIFALGAYAIVIPVVRHEEAAPRTLFAAELDRDRATVARFLPTPCPATPLPLPRTCSQILETP
ncbi:hypothetical protein GCM10011335_41790 [Aureimonas glaciei]|uniref:Isoprenylcysteine carboxylmethyltransferase family protein n=2 Tax=Aureimonas glaciei TaxID=1776957 RepID=A0A916Y8P2_9HYPH|nr:hypothetical protein GCM10011335_41790 [Aureimonas glaciei]